MTECQTSLLRDGAAAGFSLEWDLAGPAEEALAALSTVDTDTVTIGIGSPLAEATGATIPGLRPFTRIDGAAGMPATQRAVWAFVTADDPGVAFAQAEALQARLSGPFRLAIATPLFRYGGGRDLTGYIDGTANPAADAAVNAAFVTGGPAANSSFALVQRYLHFRSRFQRRPETERRRLSAAIDVSHDYRCQRAQRLRGGHEFHRPRYRSRGKRGGISLDA